MFSNSSVQFLIETEASQDKMPASQGAECMNVPPLGWWGTQKASSFDMPRCKYCGMTLPETTNLELISAWDR